MNRTVHKLCAWSGIGCLVLMATGFVGLARFFPPPAPSLNAQETTRIIIDHAAAIRWGMILTMAAAVLLGVFAVEIAIQIRRIEGNYPVLALIEFGLGMLFVLEFLYLLFFWQTATFRADRAPQLIELLNDMAWIPFVGLTGTAVLQVSAFAIAIFLDRRPTPVFPRWLGYYNLWVALIFCAGTFNVFFKNGPLAWNGFLAWWLPVIVYATWLIINSVYLLRAIDSHIAEIDASDAAQESGAPSNAALAADVARLQAQLDQILSRSG